MTFSDVVRKNIRFLIIFPLVVAVLAMGISFLSHPMYRSSFSVMVVQKQSGADVDAQAAVKSAGQMADTLSRLMGTEIFREAVVQSNQVNVDLPTQSWERSKEWGKIVKPKNITDTGILTVDVYQPTSAGATQLGFAVQSVLNAKAYDYLGVSQDSVTLRQLNPPSPTNNKPATPNIPVNTAVGYLAGLMVAFVFLLLFPNVSWDKFTRVPGNPYRNQSFKPSEVPVGASGMLYSPKLDETVQKTLETPAEKLVKDESVNFVQAAEAMLKRQF